MEFLKKHYEKILLGLVLAGLVGALVFMPFYIGSDNRDMNDLIQSIITRSGKELPPLDLSAQQTVMTRLQAPYNLDFESVNRLYNPLEWQKASDGSLIPVATHTGPQMVVVTNITPLYLIITLDSVTTNELGARYAIGVERQAEKIVAKRRHTQRYASKGDKNDTFTLEDVKGAPENPDELVIKMADSGETISISHDKPFRRIDAYSVDFRYDPEKIVYHGRRVGDKVPFNGTDYQVDQIGPDQLILQDESNQKKTARPFTP